MIGVFDSGVGGLSVLRILKQRFPRQPFFYYADTAHVPYGDRSEDQLRAILLNILTFFKQSSVNAIVMACNTSSSLLPEDIVSHQFGIPILGVIRPAAHAAAQIGSRIGILANRVTASCDVYREEILSKNPKAHILRQGCPDLVPLIESGETRGKNVQDALKRYLTPLGEEGIDTLIYGCTHYPFLDEEIRSLLPSATHIIDPAFYVADRLTPYVEETSQPDIFVSSGNLQDFKEKAKRWYKF